MKLKFVFPILLIALFNVSCSSDDASSDTPINEGEGLKKVQELTNNTHTIELFNTSGKFETGYNAISLRIKDNASNNFVENASLSWMPVMQMPAMQHSSPKSKIIKSLGKQTLYEGFIVYQMASPDGSGWSLNIDYSIDGKDYSVHSQITVSQSDGQNMSSFMGVDNERYVLALMGPENPKIGINKLKVGLFKMETMMDFPIVEDYKITLDPRMPGMGNHSSPNNTDLTYNGADKTYEGNLSLTMTGYWVLNLKLLNDQGDLLKGENITEDHPKSSLYLELEF